MKANELRIGNWVKESDGRFIHIHDGLGIDHHKQFSPIEITPEILEKAGFKVERHTYDEYWSCGWFNIRKMGNGFEFLGSEWTHGETFYFLHQLQNLYFALTGEELKIEL